MKRAIHPRRLAIIFFAAAGCYFLLITLQKEFSAESSFVAGIIDVATYLCVLILLLTPVLTLAWFVFRVWGRAYYRAWHINRIRNAKLMQRLRTRSDEE